MLHGIKVLAEWPNLVPFVSPIMSTLLYGQEINPSKKELATEAFKFISG